MQQTDSCQRGGGLLGNWIKEGEGISNNVVEIARGKGGGGRWRWANADRQTLCLW